MEKTTKQKIYRTLDVQKIKMSFLRYGCHLQSQPDKTELHDMVFLTEREWYSQLIYRYPQEYITVMLKHFEEEQDFKTCADIKNVIDIHNRINSDNVPLNLELCH